MKKLTFGTPETLTPTTFCPTLDFQPTAVSYPTDAIGFKTNARGCVLTLPLGKDEQIYGMGLQLKAFNLRGKKMVLRINADPVAPTGDSHAPVPFFVSTAGYGVFVDTARHAEFYFGSSQPLRAKTAVAQGKVATSTEELYASRLEGDSQITIQIPAAKGVDVYLFEGDTITDIVAEYNRFAGGGCDVPEWGLSTIYRCFGQYTQQQVLQAAEEFRRENMDIGILGLEPGWQTNTYSCSYVWNNQRFPNPQAMLDELKAMDYHVNLWEHAFVHPSSPVYKPLLPYSGDFEVWNGCVPDLSLKEARDVFAAHQRTIVDMGVDGFKLDECDGSDFTGGWSFPNCAEFPSGLDGEQYHSLFGVLYMQTILQSLGGTPTLSEVRNAGALSAPYPFVLYSDLYDHKDFIRGCATAGFSGLLWTPELRDAKSKEEFVRRLQTTVFSPQSLINAWYCEEMPWKQHDCADEVKYWLAQRTKLIPLLKKAFTVYHETGIPPMRALVSDYTHDPEVYNIDDQYLLGDTLLVAPIATGESTRRVYLPAGNWRDYFTKEPVQNGWFDVQTASIPVYEKY